MALQRGHVAFILRWAIIATEGAYNVGVISNVFPLFFWHVSCLHGFIFLFTFVSCLKLNFKNQIIINEVFFKVSWNWKLPC